MSSITKEEMSKIVNEKFKMLVERIDKDFLFNKFFTQYFTLEIQGDNSNIIAPCKYKTIVPEKYLNHITDHFQQSYLKKMAKPFEFWAPDLHDKTDDEIYNLLKDGCQNIINHRRELDNTVMHYKELLDKGYCLGTCWSDCNSVKLTPGQVDEYLNLIFKNFVVKDQAEYKKSIISEFANYVKKNNIERIEYDTPVCLVNLPHVFNERYDRTQERRRKNQECSKIINAIIDEVQGNNINYEN